MFDKTSIASIDTTEKKLIVGCLGIILLSTLLAPSTALLFEDKTTKNVSAEFRGVPDEIRSATFQQTDDGSTFETQTYELQVGFTEEQYVDYVIVSYGEYTHRETVNVEASAKQFSHVFNGETFVINNKFPPDGGFKIILGTRSGEIKFFMQLENNET